MKIFIDTSAFIAYFIKQEIFHRAIVGRYNFYRQQNASFLTSNFVLNELLTWFAYHQNKSVLRKLIDSWLKIELTGEIKVLEVDKVTAKTACQVMLKFSDHKISFTDAATYILCKDLSVDEVLTLDDDFKKIGLNVVFLEKE